MHSRAVTAGGVGEDRAAEARAGRPRVAEAHAGEVRLGEARVVEARAGEDRTAGSSPVRPAHPPIGACTMRELMGAARGGLAAHHHRRADLGENAERPVGTDLSYEVEDDGIEPTTSTLPA